MAKKTSIDVNSLAENNAYTSNLIAEAGSFQPLAKLQARLHTLERTKIDKSDFAIFE